MNAQCSTWPMGRYVLFTKDNSIGRINGKFGIGALKLSIELYTERTMLYLSNAPMKILKIGLLL